MAIRRGRGTIVWIRCGVEDKEFRKLVGFEWRRALNSRLIDQVIVRRRKAVFGEAYMDWG